jgi:hypothetical protein
MSAMSEVVPLPSFGEVFFDARGQERVLRVTWHEGTLVLSLWRGEMCTASFRMPMEDVGRLLETLEVGFAEAGGQFPEDGADPDDDADYPDYPGTGQYVRPPQPDHARHTVPPDQAAPHYQQGGPYAEADTRLGAVPTVGPNDVLVARGAPPVPDKLVASHPGPADGVPRENMIVGDSLPYSQPPPIEHHAVPGDLGYQLPPDAYAPNYQQPPRPPVNAHVPYAAQAQAPIEHTDPYGLPPVDPIGGYEPPRQPAPEPVDWYGTQQPTVDPSDPLGLGPVASSPQPRQSPATGEIYQQGPPSYPQVPPSEPYPPRETYPPAEPYPRGGQYQQPEAYPPPDAYRQADGYPPADSYQRGDSYPPGDAYPRGDAYPDSYQQPDPLLPRPYLQDPMYATGERLLPDHQPPRQDEHDRRDPRAMPDPRDNRGDW